VLAGWISGSMGVACAQREDVRLARRGHQHISRKHQRSGRVAAISLAFISGAV
jgi:hypothetical protein